MTDPTQPVQIADRRELFLDHHLIDSLQDARLVMHRPVTREISFKFDQPWEGRYSSSITVFQDGDKFRCYYRGTPENYDLFACVCYAQSSDGVHWEKPNLGLHEFQGSKSNNILMVNGPAHAFAPFIDTNPNVNPNHRYKALGITGSDHKPGTMALKAYVSADALNWQELQPDPVMTKGGFDSMNVAFWSHSENCYVSYFRVWSKSPDWRTFLGRRSVARATSPDFINWSDPVLMEFGPRRTEELYHNGTLPYFRAPHIYVALANRYLLGRKSPLTSAQIKELGIPNEQTFISEGVLMSTRGSNLYDRTFMEAFFPPGPDPANWVSRNALAAWGILQTSPTQMSVYYPQHYTQPTAHLVRASLRLDGFASVQAGFDSGQLLTKPFLFTGTQLELNMATSAAGFIKVQVEDPTGKPFKDFSFDDCPEMYSDQIKRTVKWQGSPWLTQLTGKPIRLRFQLKDADLYSLKFGND
jgi:hypothetical protein